jgi:ferredoxin
MTTLQSCTRAPPSILLCINCQKCISICKLTAAQLVRASRCETSHRVQVLVCAICRVKKKLSGSLNYSDDDADLGARYLGHGLVWALLPGVVAVATGMVNGFRPKYLHAHIE